MRRHIIKCDGIGKLLRVSYFPAYRDGMGVCPVCFKAFDTPPGASAPYHKAPSWCT